MRTKETSSVWVSIMKFSSISRCIQLDNSQCQSELTVFNAEIGQPFLRSLEIPEHLVGQTTVTTNLTGGHWSPKRYALINQVARELSAQIVSAVSGDNSCMLQ